MLINENKKQYTIHICDNFNNIQYMIQYIEKYLVKKEKRIIGIDFEFNRVNNKREIALCQINMEIYGNNTAIIFLFYPPDIVQYSDIFKRLLISTNIIKILHGGESLDVPYLFTEVLVNTSDRQLFCKNLFDTRYMCEYYNTSNNLVNNKCKIYDLLLQMNVININKYNELEENDRKMGNIWEINIKINKLSKSVIIYSLYDVLYLPALFDRFPKIDVYMKLLPHINTYNLINRYNDNITSQYNMISRYNTLYYENVSFNDIYISVYSWLSCYLYFDNLFQINYFKKFYEILIKNILYSKLSDEYKNKVYNNIMKDINEMNKFQKKLNKYIEMML